MTNYVLLGGNGYLGRNFSQEILKHDPTAKIYAVSRSGHNQLKNANITNIKADVTDSEGLMKKLPEKVDYIVDFIGAPENDPEKSKLINDRPAIAMKEIAEAKHVKKMGFIGGVLGPSSFVKTKKRLINELSKSSVPLAYVEPTLVYGNGRKDSMTRMVPLLKFFGIFSRKFKPVDVNDVTAELYRKLVDNAN